MARDRTQQNFILHEMDSALAAQLCSAIKGPGRALHSTVSTRNCVSVAEKRHADMVFCSADQRAYRAVLDALEQRGLRVPVVVVSRFPETSAWLEAMDAGAADYCAAPFERQQISWLVQSALLAAPRPSLAGR